MFTGNPSLPEVVYYDEEDIYCTVDPKESPPKIKNPSNRELPPRPGSVYKENIYACLKGENISNCYESIYDESTNDKSENMMIINTVNNRSYQAWKHIESFNQQRSRLSLPNRLVDEDSRSNCYESIGASKSDNASSCGSNRDSVISCDQQSNSLYGKCGWGAACSDVSSSDRSEDWIDVSDPDESDAAVGFVM